MLDSGKVVTGLAGTATYPVFGAAAGKISFLAHYFPGAAGGNEVEKAMLDAVTRAGGTPDLFNPDGFTAAQMIVHAIKAGSPTDTAAMVKALEDWRFDSPKREEWVRAEEHALLQLMFTARLNGQGADAKPELIHTLPMSAAAPTVKSMGDDPGGICEHRRSGRPGQGGNRPAPVLRLRGSRLDCGRRHHRGGRLLRRPWRRVPRLAAAAPSAGLGRRRSH